MLEGVCAREAPSGRWARHSNAARTRPETAPPRPATPRARRLRKSGPRSTECRRGDGSGRGAWGAVAVVRLGVRCGHVVHAAKPPEAAAAAGHAAHTGGAAGSAAAGASHGAHVVGLRGRLGRELVADDGRRVPEDSREDGGDARALQSWTRCGERPADIPIAGSRGQSRAVSHDVAASGWSAKLGHVAASPTRVRKAAKGRRRGGAPVRTASKPAAVWYLCVSGDSGHLGPSRAATKPAAAAPPLEARLAASRLVGADLLTAAPVRRGCSHARKPERKPEG